MASRRSLFSAIALALGLAAAPVWAQFHHSGSVDPGTPRFGGVNNSETWPGAFGTSSGADQCGNGVNDYW